MTRLVMLEIGGLGFVRSIRPEKRKLRSDACVIVIDEQTKVLWFWMGSGVQYDKRRTVKTKVDQISLEGQRIGDEVFGQGLPVVVIDQDQMENPTTSNNYTNLIAMLEVPMEINTIANPKGTLIIANLQGTVPTAIKTPEPSGPTSIPEIQRPTAAPQAKGRTKLDLEAALMAILRVHQQVHIEYSSKGDTEEVVIESIDGLQHQMKRSKGKLTFKWDSKTPKELKELVAFELRHLAG